MRKKLLAVLLTVILMIGVISLTGCNNNTDNSSTEVINNTENEIKTTMSFYHETYLFKSKKSVKYIIYLNENNKLIKLGYIEKYYEFTDDNDYKTISEGAPEEAELNNRTYSYLNETVDVNQESKEVTITDLYDVSKVESRSKLPFNEIKDNLNDEFIFNLENYKNTMTGKGYTCEEK